MNFIGLFKHEHAINKVNHVSERDGVDLVLEELSTPPLHDEPDFGVELEEALIESLAVPVEVPDEAIVESRITPHAQTRMAALSAFDDLTQGTRQDLQALGLTLAKVVSTHQLMRGFLTSVHADIHRANEMELAHGRLAAESRKLSHQVDETQKQLSVREAANEALEHRIARLTQEAASLRDDLSEARLEAGDASVAIVNLEAERADLMTSLAGKSLTVEKLLRENEVMREQQIGLTMDLDAELKAHADSQRRLEELTAAHNSNSARLGELIAKNTHSEKEIARIQKQNDAANAAVRELNETVSGLEADIDERGRRHAASIAGFETEIQSLNARLQETAKTIVNKSEQIDTLNSKLNEAVSEKRIALEKLQVLQAENARDKQKLSAAFANFSQLTVLQTSEHVMLDMHKHEAEELRREIGGLEATVKRLAPYEKVYQSSKARPGKRPAEQGKREMTKMPVQQQSAGTSKGVA